MSFAYMPLFTGDYLRDTRHLTPLRHGVYLLALMHCWDSQGPMPLDEQECAGICNCRSADEVEALRYVLARYFVKSDDGHYNTRMAEEVAKSARLSKRFSEAGLKSAQVRREKARTERRNQAAAPADGATNLGSTTLQSKVEPWSVSPSPSLSSSKKENTPLPPKGEAPAAPEVVIAPELPGIATPEADAKDTGASPAPLSDKDQVWSFGPSLLGGSEQAARTLLGKLVKEHGETVVAEALAACAKEDPGEPKAWLVKACMQRGGGAKRRSVGGEARPAWAVTAGFATRFDAENAGCHEHNASRFRDGRALPANATHVSRPLHGPRASDRRATHAGGAAHRDNAPTGLDSPSEVLP